MMLADLVWRLLSSTVTIKLFRSFSVKLLINVKAILIK